MERLSTTVLCAASLLSTGALFSASRREQMWGETLSPAVLCLKQCTGLSKVALLGSAASQCAFDCQPLMYGTWPSHGALHLCHRAVMASTHGRHGR